MAPGLQTYGQRVARRNSTHSFALDKTFRFIDGMTKLRAVAHLGMGGVDGQSPKKTRGRHGWLIAMRSTRRPFGE